MIQAIINDFQSIKEAKLKIEGITLIVGESSQGKSACLRALQAACTNRFKAGQVRHGEDHALVRIKTPESSEVLSVLRPWAGGSPRMKLGSQEFSKLGRTLPSQISEFLNLGFLDVGGESYSCNFHSQFQPPLLLAYSQPKVMELLSASSALDDLKETKDALFEVRANNKGAIVTVESILKNTQSELEPLVKEIDALEPLVSAIVECCDILDSIESKMSSLQALCQLISKYRQLTTKESVLEDLEVLEVNISAVDAQSSLLEDIIRLQATSTKIVNKEEVLTTIIRIQDPSLERKIEAVASLYNFNESLKSLTTREVSVHCRVDLLKELVSVQRYLEVESRADYAKYSELVTLKSQLDMLIAREQGLVEVVENHICPVCGSVVSYNEEN